MRSKECVESKYFYKIFIIHPFLFNEVNQNITVSKGKTLHLNYSSCKCCQWTILLIIRCFFSNWNKCYRITKSIKLTTNCNDKNKMQGLIKLLQNLRNTMISIFKEFLFKVVHFLLLVIVFFCAVLQISQFCFKFLYPSKQFRLLISMSPFLIIMLIL